MRIIAALRWSGLRGFRFSNGRFGGAHLRRHLNRAGYAIILGLLQRAPEAPVGLDKDGVAANAVSRRIRLCGATAPRRLERRRVHLRDGYG